MRPKAMKWALFVGMFVAPFSMGAGCEGSCRAKDDTGVTTEIHKAIDESKDNKEVKIKVETKRD